MRPAASVGQVRLLSEVRLILFMACLRRQSGLPGQAMSKSRLSRPWVRGAERGGNCVGGVAMLDSDGEADRFSAMLRRSTSRAATRPQPARLADDKHHNPDPSFLRR